MCSGPSNLLLHFNPACTHITAQQGGIDNSNKLVYTSTKKFRYMWTCNLQESHVWLPTRVQGTRDKQTYNLQ